MLEPSTWRPSQRPQSVCLPAAEKRRAQSTAASVLTSSMAGPRGCRRTQGRLPTSAGRRHWYPCPRPWHSPKGTPDSYTLYVFTHTVPALSERDTVLMKLMSLERMPEARPYSFWLARLTTWRGEQGNQHRRTWLLCAASSKRAGMRADGQAGGPAGGQGVPAGRLASRRSRQAGGHLGCGVEFQDGLDRAENLLACDRHVLGHVSKHGGLDLRASSKQRA